MVCYSLFYDNCFMHRHMSKSKQLCCSASELNKAHP